MRTSETPIEGKSMRIRPAEPTLRPAASASAIPASMAESAVIGMCDFFIAILPCVFSDNDTIQPVNRLYGQSGSTPKAATACGLHVSGTSRGGHGKSADIPPERLRREAICEPCPRPAKKDSRIRRRQSTAEPLTGLQIWNCAGPCEPQSAAAESLRRQ